jgi:ABC-type sulfate transport system permease subunit
MRLRARSWTEIWLITLAIGFIFLFLLLPLASVFAEALRGG